MGDWVTRPPTGAILSADVARVGIDLIDDAFACLFAERAELDAPIDVELRTVAGRPVCVFRCDESTIQLPLIELIVSRGSDATAMPFEPVTDSGVLFEWHDDELFADKLDLLLRLRRGERVTNFWSGRLGRCRPPVRSGSIGRYLSRRLSR